MRTILLLTFSFFLTFCQDKKNFGRHNSDAFYYVDKQTGDTSKFFGYRDLDIAIFYAKKEKKNILVMFSGWSVLSDPKLQWKTLSSFKDNDKIQNNFIIAWLPVDDRKLLKDTNEVVTWNGKERKLKTIGDRYCYFQHEVFKSASQPFHCFIDTMQKAFGQTLYIEYDKEKVTSFINSGLTK